MKYVQTNGHLSDIGDNIEGPLEGLHNSLHIGANQAHGFRSVDGCRCCRHGKAVSEDKPNQRTPNLGKKSKCQVLIP